GGVEGAGAKPFADGGVGRVGDDAFAESDDGGLDTVAELVEGSGAGGSGFGSPGFEEALLGRVALETGAVAHQPQDDEVAEPFAAEEGFEVELDVSLPGERGVVAQQAEGEPVADDAPQVGVGAVEKLLDQAVG